MGIYTKTGDQGTTALIGGERVSKCDPRVDAYGTVDELSAFIAYLRDHMDIAVTALDEYRDDLKDILNTLMNVEAQLAAAGSDPSPKACVYSEDIGYLERRIDYISQQLPSVQKFTIPGGHPLVSLTHICRTVCRRAERAAVDVVMGYGCDHNVVSYLNRLSDYLYVLGRRLCNELGIDEELWEPRSGANK